RPASPAQSHRPDPPEPAIATAPAGGYRRAGRAPGPVVAAARAGFTVLSAGRCRGSRRPGATGPAGQAVRPLRSAVRWAAAAGGDRPRAVPTGRPAAGRRAGVGD